MRKFTAILACLLLLASPAASLGQGIIQGTVSRKVFPPTSDPSFVAYTFVANTSCGSTCSSITTPAITLTTGDFVFQFCRNNLNVASNPMTFTSTPSNTWNALTSDSLPNNIHTSSAYSFTVGGSTTFTCTPNTA